MTSEKYDIGDIIEVYVHPTTGFWSSYSRLKLQLKIITIKSYQLGCLMPKEWPKYHQHGLLASTLGPSYNFDRHRYNQERIAFLYSENSAILRKVI